MPPRRRLPALDGVRGLAAVAVVFSHGMDWRGFNLGVDVFFVLSGFLITSLLLEELTERRSIDLMSFYLRRARRLLPPLLPVVLVGTFIDLFAIPGGDASGPIDTLLYAQSIRVPLMPGVPDDALLHTWSLSIEEHFYLVWPLLLAVAWRWRGEAAALAVAALGIAAANADRFWLVFHGASEHRVYFADDTRADALLIGCTVAILARMGRLPRVPGILAVCAAAGMGAAAIVGSLGYRPPLAAAILVPTGAAVIIARLAQSSCPWLETRVLLYLGQISYALYLWHALPVVYMNRTGILPPGPVRLVLIGALGLGMAVLSDSLIEAPIRRWAGRRRLALQPAVSPAA